MFRAARIVLILCLVGVSFRFASAEGLTQDQVAQTRLQATGAAYGAAGVILECLSIASQGKDSSGLIEQARAGLQAARDKYTILMMSDRADSHTNLAQSDEVKDQVVHIEGILSNEYGLGDLKTEGDVARVNIQAIDQLLKQINGWTGCKAVVRNRVELLKLLENKILLERTSQVAEAVWPIK